MARSAGRATAAHLDFPALGRTLLDNIDELRRRALGGAVRPEADEVKRLRQQVADLRRKNAELRAAAQPSRREGDERRLARLAKHAVTAEALHRALVMIGPRATGEALVAKLASSRKDALLPPFNLTEEDVHVLALHSGGQVKVLYSLTD